MVGESNQNVFFNQIDASSFAEFEIFEFEISRVDCIDILKCNGVTCTSYVYLDISPVILD